MRRHSEHVDEVFEAVESSKAALSSLAASWARSITKYGLHPGKTSDSHRILTTDLHQRQEKCFEFIALAAPRLDNLFKLVGKPGCAVLLTDCDGIVMDQRFNAADSDMFKASGLWQGTDWSERTEGTNGIGTCLTENRNVVIHRNEHFHARNIGISCIDAPIYAPDGSIMGALDVSSARNDHGTAMNGLIAALVNQAAGHIEADGFRSAYSNYRIVMASGGENDCNILLAVDEDDVVIGATRKARQKYKLGLGPEITPCLASELLHENAEHTGFAKAEKTALMQALTQNNNNIAAAARQLGIGRATMYRRMNRLDISIKS